MAEEGGCKEVFFRGFGGCTHEGGEHPIEVGKLVYFNGVLSLLRGFIIPTHTDAEALASAVRPDQLLYPSIGPEL